MASSGWLATYGIFSILEGRCKSMYQSSIHLQPSIVELCLRQSLRFSPVGCWKCSFPLTISPGLGHFSILNVVYCFEPGLNGCVSAQVPTNLDARLERSWKSETKRILSYSYNLSWSPDSRYIAFSDLEIGAGADGRDAGCIAVFSMTSNQVDNQTLILVRHTLTPCWANQMHMTNSQFHPTKPLFLFTVGSGIFIWRFQGMVVKII